MQTARYWRYVCKLAWRETKHEILKSAARAILTAAALLALIHFGVPAGLGPVTAGLAVVGAALLAFLWKMIVIPARLHDEQASARERKEVGRKLEALADDGERLLHDSGRGGESWANQAAMWDAQVMATLSQYSDGERWMFASVARGMVNTPSAQVAALDLKLGKLRLIIGRAYGVPSGSTPDDAI